VAIADLSQLAATSGAVAEHSLEGAMPSSHRSEIQTIIDGVAEASDVHAVYLLNAKAVAAASPGVDVLLSYDVQITTETELRSSVKHLTHWPALVR
jgi:hypothetical protein